MEQIQKLWTGILDTLSKLVIPDWGALIALLPVFILVGVLLWLVMTVRAYAVLGPRQRGRRYIAGTARRPPCSGSVVRADLRRRRLGALRLRDRPRRRWRCCWPSAA